MRILLIHPTSPVGSGENVIHRPDLVTASDEVVARVIEALAPDAVVRPGGDPAEALAKAEREWADRLPVPVGTSSGKAITVVGAGIVNLVSALYLVRAGYRVVVVEKAPDPRVDAHWTAYGCTRGGGDGRMFTLTEADSYNSRAWPANDLLTRSITDHGWLVAKPGGLSAAELSWADDFHRIPPWLAESYTEDIFDVNRAAGVGWDRLMAEEPDLFDDETGYRDGILRLYTDDDYYRWHVARNERIGATRRVLTPQQVRAGYPALDEAPVAGGIEVVGFTVNIHRFLARLVGRLDEEGVEFRWGTTVTGISWARPGVPDGLQGLPRTDHYLLSPGAYGEELLRGTASHGLIMGMLGVWLTVPNVEPRLDHSVKIARKGHRAEETNVTLGTGSDGEPILICGAGYGWTGTDPGNIDSTELDMLFEALEDTIRRFFPRAYAAARKAGARDIGTGLAASRQVCVRPWTASCLGVFETIVTESGGTLIVTGGHNTGGFTQSPAVADAVLAALQNQKHPMHTRFHPSRATRSA